MEHETVRDARRDDRRSFLSWASTVGMAAGLAAAYGTLLAFVARFLYPARSQPRTWQFVADTGSLEPGRTFVYRLPNGAPVNVTRLGSSGEAADFRALSSTCPHLGCQVHWEPHNNRYFCPCHNGIFTPDGKGVGGPPGDAGLDLLPYPLKVESGLLFIEIPFDQLAGEARPGRIEAPGGPPGPGHDPCLYCRAARHESEAS